MKSTRLILITAVFLICSSAWLVAQQATALRLNEILISNETNYIDGYGNRSPWIEIYNTSAASVNLRGCFLTNDPNNLKKYPIPKGDVLTNIPPYQHRLFWADSTASRGTFHANFGLYTDRSNFIALVDADGKTIIDSITVPMGLLSVDESYGRELDGKDANIEAGHRGWIKMPKVTPETNNLTLDTNAKIDRIKKHDTDGLIMTITAMLVVFIGLVVLATLFKSIGVLSVKVSDSKVQAPRARPVIQSKRVAEGIPSDEESAVIALALSQALGIVHDEETLILSIQQQERKYSPWSSKIYTLRQQPERRFPHNKTANK